MKESQEKRLRLRVVTLGCSKNTVDTEHLLAQLPSDRFEIVPDGGGVDYLLVNTCGFIGDAKEESVQAVLEAVELKKRGDVWKLAVFGCLSQRYSSELQKEIPEVDAWFGARGLGDVLAWLGVSAGPLVSRYPTGRGSYAYIKVSEGCDRRCSYCAIPYIRGAHHSVPIEDIVTEASSLAAAGAKELILIAQDTTYYGLDIYHKRMLAPLLRELSAIDGVERLRIHYSYPDDFPEDVIAEMADNPKVCRYLDIPLQHISDKVLSMMHRNVDGAWTRNLIARMRREIPGVVLRTTMIVGHPGEGEKEFRELLDFVTDARFERLGAFMYSEEEGTYGAKHYRDEVPPEVKQERLDRLMELQRDISLDYNASRLGSIVKVLVDDVLDGGVLVCRSEFESPEVDGEILVRDSSCSVRPGDFIDVRIKEAGDYDLVGEIIKVEP